MIRRLKTKDIINIYDFFNEIDNTRAIDFYITQNNNRLFFKNNIKLIQKIIKNQEVYGKFNGDFLVGIFIIYREKNFRPYLKIIGNNLFDIKDLLRFFKWIFEEKEIYYKLHKTNKIINLLMENGFYNIGDRGIDGKEILLVKKIYKVKPKGEIDGYYYK